MLALAPFALQRDPRWDSYPHPPSAMYGQTNVGLTTPNTSMPLQRTGQERPSDNLHLLQDHPGEHLSRSDAKASKVSASVIAENAPRGPRGSVQSFGELFLVAKRAMDDSIQTTTPIDFWGPRIGEPLLVSSNPEADH